MGNSQRGCSFFSSRKRNFTRIRDNYNDYSANKYHYNYRKYLRIWPVILLFFAPIKAYGNTTVASPQSNSSGVVNNNATMITPGLWPMNRYSQGIQCVGPSLTVSPFLTNTHTYATPTETVTRTPIYDEDTGNIKYYSEIPRFEKENFSDIFGISLQFNIPLGQGIALCHEALKTNIETQQLLNKKTRLEIALHRLKICSEQMKLGVRFKSDSSSAIACSDIEVIVRPNQVLPHTHQIKVKK